MSWELEASFRVFGEPKGQPRVRRAKSGGVFTPATAMSFKEAIQIAAITAGLRGRALSGPVRVDARFFFHCPKRLEKAVRQGPVLYTSKPDRDNCDKVLLDALTQIGAYGDDAQVAAGNLEKWYAGPGESPGALIRISTWKAA